MSVLDKLMIFAAGKDSVNKIPKQQAQILTRVLVAEADPALGYRYSQLITERKCEVRIAANGADALNTILTFRPDIVLIDLNLPIMDGKEMLHHMRAIPDYKTTPVLVISDKGDIDTIKQVKLYDGAKGFLIKENVTPEQTIATLLDLI